MILHLLHHGATSIAIRVTDGFEICSDAEIKLEQMQEGIAPFECAPYDQHSLYMTLLLAALSQNLSVIITTDRQRQELQYTHGIRNSYSSGDAHNEPPGIILRFNPDRDIFTATAMDPSRFKSSLFRLSRLNSGVRFSLSMGEETQVFYTENSIYDLFLEFSARWPLVHAPIPFFFQEGDLRVELVIAFHSGDGDHLLSYVNNAHTYNGGTHEEGLRQTFGRLRSHFTRIKPGHNRGVVAVMSLHSPSLIWGTLSTFKIYNSELKRKVYQMVRKGMLARIEENPEVAAEIGQWIKVDLPED